MLHNFLNLIPNKQVVEVGVVLQICFNEKLQVLIQIRYLKVLF